MIMKQNKLSQDQKSDSVSRPDEVAGLNQNETDFVPSPDEVARRAYFSYLNEGSKPGHEVQHWLDAEAQLIKEWNLTRAHGFDNRRSNKK
jgi:hypothetical protein